MSKARMDSGKLSVKEKSEQKKSQNLRDEDFGIFRGCKMGFEPTTPGTTIQCSNQLSYMHHLKNVL